MPKLSHSESRDIGDTYKTRVQSRVFDENTLKAEMNLLGREEGDSITSCAITAMLVSRLASQRPPSHIPIRPDADPDDIMNKTFELADQGNFVVVELSPTHYFSFSAYGSDYYQIYQGYQGQYTLCDWLTPANNDGRRRKITVVDQLKRLFSAQDEMNKANAAEILFACEGIPESGENIRQDFGRRPIRFKSVSYLAA